MGTLTDALDDGGAAAGEGLLRLAVAARGVWDVLGELRRLQVGARVTLETTLSDFVRLLPPDAQAALGVVGDPGAPDPLTVTYELAGHVARISVPRATFRGLSLGGAAAEALEAEDVRICVTGPVDALTITASVGRVRATGLALERRTRTSLGALELDAVELEASDLAPDPARVDDPARPLRASLTVGRAAIADTRHDALAVGRAEGRGLELDLDQGEGRVTLRIAEGRATGLAGPRGLAAEGSVRGLCASVRDPGGKLPLLRRRPDRPEIEARIERAEGSAITIAAGGTPVATDPTWVRAVGAAVRDVDASARIALPPVHLGVGPASVDVAEGTNASAEVVVRGGRIDAPRTRLSFDRPLDGPLWADIRGATLSEDGRAKVEVDGFPDPDVTRIVAWVLDLPERRIPLDLTTLSALVADRLEGGGGPSRPRPDVAVDAGAARITTGAFALPIGHARVRIVSSEVRDARVRVEGGELEAEVGHASGDGLVLHAVGRPTPAEAANVPEEEPGNVVG